MSAHDYGKEKAVEVYNYAKDRARDGERAVADAGYDALSGGAEAARRGYGRASAARKVLTTRPVRG